MPTTPYSGLPSSAYWKSAVAERDPSTMDGLWEPKFHITPDMRVSTYGSCFAQHIGRALKDRGYAWVNAELPPHGMSAETASRFNYGVFSARTANIYTPTLLRQWAEWAFGHVQVPDEVWESGGRFYDPFRPRIEPDGFASEGEMRRSREAALKAFRDSVTGADLFVFTLGLTERWLNVAGYEYPMCPGTVAGTFDPGLHKFDNLTGQPIIAAMKRVIEIFRSENPELKFLLTVSPVPLTATASGKHVLVATMQSKSILRTAAAHLVELRRPVDYFPSYEIVSNPIYGATYFDENRRNVSADGVARVMNVFFESQAKTFGAEPAAPAKGRRQSLEDLVCEEELLESFGGRA